jgi:ParB/RepB/Spo0J family partition protein
MSVGRESAVPGERASLKDLPVVNIDPNERNPRLDFPRNELDRLAESIDQEGILVPIVVFPRGERYVLVDGERRFRCARELGLESVPALVTRERSERETLQQMFNIHHIREHWRDMPTAMALQRLSDSIKEEQGVEPNDGELKVLTGLSVDRIRQLRYVAQLPDEWQSYIRDGVIPLNFFWELKKNVIDALRANRPKIFEHYGERSIQTAFVKKRLDQVITDTVSLRKVAPIIKFAAQDASESPEGESKLDTSIKNLIERPDSTIDDVYEDTVQMIVEVDRLNRRTSTMVAIFVRLLRQTQGTAEHETVKSLGRQFIDELSTIISASSET